MISRTEICFKRSTLLCHIHGCNFFSFTPLGLLYHSVPSMLLLDDHKFAPPTGIAGLTELIKKKQRYDNNPTRERKHGQPPKNRRATHREIYHWRTQPLIIKTKIIQTALQ